MSLWAHIMSGTQVFGFQRSTAQPNPYIVLELELDKATAQIDKVLQVLHAVGLGVQVVSTVE